MAEKRYLMTPGPTPAPPEVLAAIGQPVIHHRGPDYRQLYGEALGRLQEVFRTEQEVLLFGGSGSGAMESAVANLCSPGDPVLVVSAGYFGERWAAIANAYGSEVDHLRYAWGEIPSADEVMARLREREARIVFFTHSETSTGVVVDPQPFAAAAREAGALSAIDAVSSLGAVPLETDAWGARRRCLGLPEGADDAARSRAGLGLARRLGTQRGRDLAALLLGLGADAQGRRPRCDAPFTPPSRSWPGSNVALGLLLEEGLEAAFDRHRPSRPCLPRGR